MTRSLLAFFPCLLFANACTVQSDSRPIGPRDGTLVLDWTIDDTTDPNQCAQGAATDIDVIVDTTAGDSVGEFQQSCGAFATSIPLPPGDYTANAVLLDANGDTRTTDVQIPAFTILGADSLDIPIDFPAAAFK